MGVVDLRDKLAWRLRHTSHLFLVQRRRMQVEMSCLVIIWSVECTSFKLKFMLDFRIAYLEY